MLKKTLTALATLSCLAAGSAFADRPGADWITLEQALEKAKAAGYTLIYKIEADDNGYWEGEGAKTKEDTKTHEFRIDGKTGQVIRDQVD
ncbi:PepSY domain-containing protein [Pseudomonas sp. RIT-PI-AD]|uniref:PepSY domain-containing protein n=1 Tax=Pseudomonas sp. RIT-PI-AD TaxID=3035294 RepID=UPI0021DA122D|nr:PepSY domain-containing protein [Pseudomonas sp. RIT-PI-AD]